jgi:hypothetical protein
MRHLEFKFQPQEVRISPEEILADLSYPVPVRRRPDEDKRAPRRRART